MPLLFQPKPGSVVMCDFSGFVVPEMVKFRPVVVIARNKQNSHLVTVVPLSTTKPRTMDPCHHQLSANPLPDKPHTVCWAKCDMLNTVSVARLDRYRLKKNRFVIPQILQPDFEALQRGVAFALNIQDTVHVPERGL